MPLPSRVLDIGVHAAANVIKLIECSTDVRGKYTCLSHCWGSTGLLTTTRTTYAAHISGILMAHLPRSFADALVLTRRLGLRFLWIDSLCIIQDDRDDWVRESSRMAAVYSQAHVVLAADRAEHSAVGMFHIRDSRPRAVVAGFPLPLHDGEVASRSAYLIHAQLLFPREVFPREEKGWLIGLFDDEPLAERGWALQERVLSRRVLHFGERQMYFECCSDGLVGETGCHDPERNCDVSRLDENDNVNHGDTLSFWYNLVFTYGGRKLSKTSDKLPAMDGLARLTEGRRTGGRRQYVAGLWSDGLIEGLAWQGLSGHPATCYIGPSWSWASFDGTAVTGFRDFHNETWHDVAEVLKWHIELENEANPYGEVKDAWIRLRAPMARVLVSKKGPTGFEEKVKKAGIIPFPRLCTKYSQDQEGEPMRPEYEYMWPRKAGGRWTC